MQGNSLDPTQLPQPSSTKSLETEYPSDTSNFDLSRRQDCGRSASRDLQQFAARQHHRTAQIPRSLDLNRSYGEGLTNSFPSPFRPPRNHHVAASPMSENGGHRNSFESEVSRENMNSRMRSCSADYYGRRSSAPFPSTSNVPHDGSHDPRFFNQELVIDHSPGPLSNEPPPLSHFPVPLPNYPHSEIDMSRDVFPVTSNPTSHPDLRVARYSSGAERTKHPTATSGPSLANARNSMQSAPVESEFRVPQPWSGK